MPAVVDNPIQTAAFLENAGDAGVDDMSGRGQSPRAQCAKTAGGAGHHNHIFYIKAS